MGTPFIEIRTYYCSDANLGLNIFEDIPKEFCISLHIKPLGEKLLFVPV